MKAGSTITLHWLTIAQNNLIIIRQRTKMAAGSSKSFLDLSSHELNGFIDEYLQPDESFLRDCSQNMDFLADYLKNHCRFSIQETIKGGSLGKGTAVKGRSDLDVVVYLANEFSDMDDFTRKIRGVITTLQMYISDWSKQRRGKERVEIEGTTAHAVKIRVRYSKQDGTDFIDVDLLPAYNIMEEGKNTAYQQMQNMSPHERELFSASLVSLQLDFVRKQPPNVKNLIRLVKHWRKTMFTERSHGPKLPTSYVFELLTIYAWERAGRPARFDSTKGFMAVLKILKDYQNLDVSWEENYSKSSYSKTASKSWNQPFILDPANPFNNVCARFDAWPEVSQVAHASLQRPLFKGISLQKRGSTAHGYIWE